MKVAGTYILFGIVYLSMIVLIYKKAGIKDENLNYKLALFSIYFIAVLLRVYKFNTLPGLDSDEAMGAINSWSLGKWGVDYFNLASHPIYLYAWGSGMNILYPTIAIPFIKVLGLNIVAYRSPLIILNIIAIGTVIFALIKSEWTKRNILLFTIIVFLTPVTIVNCRWAVESNLFPTIFYLVFALFLLYQSTNGTIRNIYWVILNLLIAISAYAYSNNWMFLGIFVILLLVWQIFNQFISIKTACLTLIGYLVIEFPLILFLYVNYISKKSISLFGLTIPKLAATRSAFVHLDINSICSNLESVISILWSGCDNRPKMGLSGLGAFLPFMISFAFAGIIILSCKGKMRSNVDNFILIMLISVIPNIIFVEASWLHLNALLLPLLYCEVIGVGYTFSSKRTLGTFYTLFVLLLALYCKNYVKDNVETFNNYFNTTSVELGNMISNANSSDNIYIYADNNKNYTNVGSMYVLPIFYNKLDPWTYKKEAKIIKNGEWRSAFDYGKWHIRFSPDFNKVKRRNDNVTYIIQNGTVSSNKLKHYKKITEGDYYTVYR